MQTVKQHGGRPLPPHTEPEQPVMQEHQFKPNPSAHAKSGYFCWSLRQIPDGPLLNEQTRGGQR
jgi:hypothetical protein